MKIHSCLDCGSYVYFHRTIDTDDKGKAKNRYLCPNGCVPTEVWEDSLASD